MVFVPLETNIKIHKIIDRLKVSENRMLKRIFESKRKEVTGEWRKCHEEGLHTLYSLPDIIRVIK